MSCCSHCQDAEGFFGAKTARKELRRYRRKGPGKSTRHLVEALRHEAHGATLLDVGGGIGVIQHELFRAGLARATQVDASTPYLEASRTEAERAGRGDRTTFVYGDFAEVAGELPEADLVTLDRVICCYPYLEALLGASVGRTRRILGLVYPRERWGTRVALTAANLWLRIRGSAFRVFLHSPTRVQALVKAAGFRPASTGHTFLWRIETYVREEPTTSEAPETPAPPRS